MHFDYVVMQCSTKQYNLFWCSLDNMILFNANLSDFHPSYSLWSITMTHTFFLQVVLTMIIVATTGLEITNASAIHAIWIRIAVRAADYVVSETAVILRMLIAL